MKPSGIITLVTDFGLTDPYVGMMKGVMLTINPNARLVDISHQVRAGSIPQGAGLVHETASFFPVGTVHVAVVDPGVGGKRRPIALEGGGHLFVGPDNGIFWPLIENHLETKIIHLTESKYFLPSVSQTFHGRDIFAPAAAHLSLGVDLELMGQIINDPFQLQIPKPQKKRRALYGQIIRVDNFGNLITNIPRKDLEPFLQSHRPIIEVGNLVINKFSRAYAEVSAGEPLALLGSSDFLEIAVNLGRASERVGKKSGEILGTQVKVSKAG